MATFKQVKAKAEREKDFLARLIVNPKKALADANLEITEPADANRLELFVRVSQQNIAAAGKVVGIKPGIGLEWGIGASCCNGTTLVTGRQRKT